VLYPILCHCGCACWRHYVGVAGRTCDRRSTILLEEAGTRAKRNDVCWMYNSVQTFLGSPHQTMISRFLEKTSKSLARRFVCTPCSMRHCTYMLISVLYKAHSKANGRRASRRRRLWALGFSGDVKKRSQKTVRQINFVFSEKQLVEHIYSTVLDCYLLMRYCL